jgi:hypothetical protein
MEIKNSSLADIRKAAARHPPGENLDFTLVWHCPPKTGSFELRHSLRNHQFCWALSKGPSGQAPIPNSRFTSSNFTIAKVRSSIEWAAEICVRIRAFP